MMLASRKEFLFLRSIFIDEGAVQVDITGEDAIEERRRDKVVPTPEKKDLRYRPNYTRRPESFERNLSQEAFLEASQEHFLFSGSEALSYTQAILMARKNKRLGRARNEGDEISEIHAARENFEGFGAHERESKLKVEDPAGMIEHESMMNLDLGS